MILAPSASRGSPAQTFGLNLAPVYVGGVTADMRQLADPDHSASLRAAGGAFYAHASYVLEQTSGECPAQTASSSLAQTIRVFAAAPPPLAEIGFSSPLALTQLIGCNYQAIGLQPEVALVNIDMATTGPDAWRAFVAAGQAAGLRRLGPIVSPNLRSDPQDWNDPYWSRAKALARIGGALGMDTPPLLRRSLGDGYVRFARQQLRWCAENKIPCFDIISPSNGEQGFTDDALAWKRSIVADGIGPTAWVVENYVAGTTPSIDETHGSSSIVDSALALIRPTGGSDD